MAKLEFYIRVGISGKDAADFRKREGTKLKNDLGLDLGVGSFDKMTGPDRHYKVVKYWVITELHTGTEVGSGESRKEAIEKMKNDIEKLGGIEVFKQKLKDYVTEHGESPLYKTSCTYMWGRDKA